MESRNLHRCGVDYDMIKKAFYFIGLMGVFGSLITMFFIASNILLYGYIRFIEPNLLILLIEFILIINAILIFPIMVYKVFK